MTGSAGEPALLGGSPVADGGSHGRPLIDEAEHAAVARVLQSGVLSGFVGAPGPHFLGGPEVRALEEKWAALGSYHGVAAVNSATAGLHAAIASMELPEGSVVVVPPWTMSATVAAVLQANLQPRFADIDPDLFTLTDKTVESVLDDEVSAIVVVHLFGQMAPMDGLRRLAAEHGLRILEDAAQAPGATQNGAWPGHGSAAAVFSFNQNKVVTCGEGGLVCTDDPAILERVRLVRNHGESCVHVHPDVAPERVVGYNYRLTEVEAAIAQAQTDKLHALNSHRIALAGVLADRLASMPGVRPPVVAPGNTHVYYTFAVRVDPTEWGISRATLVAALQAEGVPCSAGYVDPLYRLPFFDRMRDTPEFDPQRFPSVNRLADDEVVLVNACRWPADDTYVSRVADAFEKCIHARDRLRAWEASEPAALAGGS
jgi:perosamine synthetase